MSSRKLIFSIGRLRGEHGEASCWIGYSSKVGYPTNPVCKSHSKETEVHYPVGLMQKNILFGKKGICEAKDPGWLVTSQERGGVIGGPFVCEVLWKSFAEVNIIRNILPIVTFVLEKMLFNSPKFVRPGHILSMAPRRKVFFKGDFSVTAPKKGLFM